MFPRLGIPALESQPRHNVIQIGMYFLLETKTGVFTCEIFEKGNFFIFSLFILNNF